MRTSRDWGLFARTVVHLRPEQVAHRMRLGTQRVVLDRRPSLVRVLKLRGSCAGAGWPETYPPLDAVVERVGAKDLAQGRFCFLNQERSLVDPLDGERIDWEQADAPRLWRFHLHYFEWAWALAQSADKAWARQAFAELWRSWRREVPAGKGDAWSPYVVSLRAWALCGIYPALVHGSDIEVDFLDMIALHGGFLRAHLELDVGGNHLIKNLKALVGLGVFLGRQDLVRLGCRHLGRQLAVQVLSDGGHFERSPSYHCQVLGDLLDVRGLLAAAGEAPVADLEMAIGGMRQWLGAMVGPDGEVPLLNDAIPVGVQRVTALGPVLVPSRPITVLGPSGYVVVRADTRSFAVLDVGDPCPDDLPAHAHADCLSFELWVDGQRVVVDTGTSTYEAGARRSFERSTAAHNTVEIDGKDQTEVWGTFRAARRARGRLNQVVGESEIYVDASHDGYHRVAGSPTHRRRWTFVPGRVDIEDTISGTGRHGLVSRIYLAEAAAGLCVVEGRGGEVSEEPASAAWGFGEHRPSRAQVLRCDNVLLPCILCWRIAWQV